MTNNKKIKRIKKETFQSEGQEEMKRFFIILIIILVLVLGIYFFTRIFITKDLLNKNKEKTEEKTTSGTIDYNTTLISNMFNKSNTEYYVIIYNTEDFASMYYNSLVSKYKQNKDALNVYIADLNNEFNKKYISKENVNVNTENLENFKVDNLALLKISKGKIINSYTKLEDIEKTLEYIKDENNSQN